MSDGLDGFPVVIGIDVAWGEMDSFGHVNNIVYFRYFESARIAYFRAVRFTGRDGPLGPILAAADCRFRRPLVFPDRVHAGARVTDVGSDRFTMQYRLVSEAQDTVVAEGSGLIVCYDYAAGAKAPLPDDVRARIDRLERGGGAAS